MAKPLTMEHRQKIAAGVRRYHMMCKAGKKHAVKKIKKQVAKRNAKNK